MIQEWSQPASHLHPRKTVLLFPSEGTAKTSETRSPLQNTLTKHQQMQPWLGCRTDRTSLNAIILRLLSMPHNKYNTTEEDQATSAML